MKLRTLFYWPAILSVSAALSQIPSDSVSIRPAIRAVQKVVQEYAQLLRPTDLVTLALADARTLTPVDAAYTRWLAISDGAIPSLKTASLAMNYVSRATTIQRPLPVANGHLARVDLRRWWPRVADLKEAVSLWEEFRYDPAFSLLLTPDTVRFAGQRAAVLGSHGKPLAPGVLTWRTESRVVNHPGGDYVYPDDTGLVSRNVAPGRYNVELRFKVQSPAPPQAAPKAVADVVRLDPLHIDPATWSELQLLTGSACPVVDHRYFKARALATIQSGPGDPAGKLARVYKPIWGGIYYELRGIRTAKEVLGPDTKATDLDVFFESLGIGNIKGGLTAEKLFERLRSDQRIAMTKSDVTGKPRDVAMFHTPADREGGAWGAITGDIFDESVDIGDRAFANLLSPRRDGREAIFPGATSVSIFALFDGEGKLVREAPSNLVNDRTIPTPHAPRLEAAISCLRCHYADGSDGWKPMANHVKSMLDGRMDAIGDLAARGLETDPDTIDRLGGLYAGNFDKQLRRARDDVAEVTLRATGPWPDGGEQVDIAKLSGLRLQEEFNEYRYGMVDARQALLELGYRVPAEQAVAVLKRLAPPDGRAELPGVGAILESASVVALKAGLGVSRADFALITSPLAERVQRSVAKNLAEGKQWYD